MERSREMLVGFGEVDEERTIEAFEEVEEEYGCEDLNRLEGIGERVTVGPDGPVEVERSGFVLIEVDVDEVPGVSDVWDEPSAIYG